MYFQFICSKSQGAQIAPLKLSLNLFCGVVLDGVLVRLNHLLYHLTADATCLLCGKVAVVTLVEVNANFACSLHLELVKSFLCFGNELLIACHNF